jgi:MOSC domain-containing protein YiiM
MQLISVNLGQERAIQHGKPSGKTGIFKLPVTQPVQVTALGLSGDTIVDTENHGGVDQAVYLYSTPDYDWWSAELGRALDPGTFGENLTISEFESAKLSIGDRFHIAQVVLEVTSPRIPCVTLAARMQDPTFVKRFRHAERPGVYCRVIQQGSIQAGDAVIFEPYTQPTLLAIEMFRDFYQPQRDEATLRRFLAAPIHFKDREQKAAQLQKLLINKV